MKRKIFTLLLAVAASIGTINAYIVNGTFGSGSNLTWSINTEDSTMTIEGGGYMKDWSSVSLMPWSGCFDYIKYVTLPDGIKSIGTYTFNGCSKLTSIEIPNTVESIKEGAFYGCSSLISAPIGNSVTSIGKYAFRSCSSLTSIEIPNTVKSIGDYAFAGCSSLTSIEIPNSVKSIANYAFSGCSSLTYITISNRVTSIGSNAFSSCSGLTSVEIPNSITSIEDGVFSRCTGLTSVIIPNSVTSIGNNAFSECYGLSSIEIPNSVTSIGNNAFYFVNNIVYSGSATGSPWGARSMNGYVDGNVVYSDETKTTLIGCSSAANGEIVIPNSVTSIGNNAFYECSGLTSIVIPNSVTNIGDNAFYKCSGLTSVVIPNSVTSIGDNAFRYCGGLTSIEIPNSITSIGNSAFYSCKSLTSVTIPNSVTSIGDDVFYGCTGLSSVTIPNSVTSIGDWAFGNCSGLTSVTIPNSVTNIGGCAFYKCGLTSVIIGNHVTSIGDYAFRYCGSLTSIEIPSSVTSIGDDVFYGCNLSSVTCRATTPPAIESGTFPDRSILVLVPAASIEAYQNATFWEDFTNIQAIPTQNLIVKFLDWDGTVLSSAEVEKGSAATSPADPTREGYTFIGWDQDFSNVTEDMIITALYEINHYQVNFVDWDGTILKSEDVDHNNAATAPANPTREGYDFVGWDKTFDHVTANMTVTALYEEGQTMQYHLTFVNSEDEIFDQVIIVKVPATPIIQGFTFVKWQIVEKDFVDSIIIEAVYQANTPTSAPAVYTNPANPAQKLIREGNVYILRGDKIYDLTGKEVK